MELTIAQTLTRPIGENRLSLEITMGSGVMYQYEIAAVPYYRALKEILLTEKPARTVIEPVAHPSSFTEVEVASPS
jgi:hypothetical protein